VLVSAPSPKRTWACAGEEVVAGQRKVHDDEGVIASTRGACAPQRWGRRSDNAPRFVVGLIRVGEQRFYLLLEKRIASAAFFYFPWSCGTRTVTAFVEVLPKESLHWTVIV
jgi:hypothetical protein